MPDSVIKVDNLSGLTSPGVGLQDGSVSSPALKFSNDSDTGLYRIGSNNIGVAAGGSKVLEIDQNTFSAFPGGVERFRIASNGQISSVVPGGSTLYNGFMCRAWVNFNGVDGSIRASGNVSSIAKNGTGDYTVNFTTAMPDANYSISGYSAYLNNSVASTQFRGLGNCIRNAGTLRIQNVYISATNGGAGIQDDVEINIGIFR